MDIHQNGSSKGHIHASKKEQSSKKQGGIASMFANTSKKNTAKEAKHNGSHVKESNSSKHGKDAVSVFLSFIIRMMNL